MHKFFKENMGWGGGVGEEQFMNKTLSLAYATLNFDQYSFPALIYSQELHTESSTHF